MDWNILPLLCRADNVEARSIEWEELREKERAKAERASGPGSARGSGESAGTALHLERSLESERSPQSRSPWSDVDYEA